jgi:predicted nuclease of restriction endonuclease-like RecB superfamily
VITTLTTIIQHAKEWFLHAKCDVDTYECDYDTHESDYDTHESDYDTHESDYDTYSCQKHTLRVEITLLCDVHTHTVMNTRTGVISERKVWF